MAELIIFNKPFNVLSQFSDTQGRPTLSDYVPMKNIYPAGRLDFDSEGLIALTDSGPLQARISEPKFKLHKTYWVQVEGRVSKEAISVLCQGVQLKDGLTSCAQAKVIVPPDIWDRVPPIRVRNQIPTSWIKLIISEGRNRQVRRMTAALGFPTLRLIRYAIGPWTLESLQPGEYKTEIVHLPQKVKRKH